VPKGSVALVEWHPKSGRKKRMDLENTNYHLGISLFFLMNYKIWDSTECIEYHIYIYNYIYILFEATLLLGGDISFNNHLLSGVYHALPSTPKEASRASKYLEQSGNFLW
jgi:hypothetical protein